MLHFPCLLRQFATQVLCYFLCFVAPTCTVFSRWEMHALGIPKPQLLSRLNTTDATLGGGI